MNLGLNLFAGLLSSGWLALASLIATPFFIRYLGLESYGLIGFYSTLQAVLLIFDLGFTQTISREMARAQATGSSLHAGDLLRTMAVIYWAFAVLVGLLVVFFAPAIASHWVNPSSLGADTVTQAIMLMGFLFASRWVANLYQGALLGVQQIAPLAIVNVVCGTLASLGTVALMALVSRSIETFFIWQAAVGLLQTLLLQRLAWKHLPDMGRSAPRFSGAAIARIWKFSAAMSAITFTSLALSQIDKIILSKVLTLEQFGLYMLAFTVVSKLYIVVMPFFNAISPRLAALQALGDAPKIIQLYRTGSWILASMIFPISAILAFFPQDIMLAWTGDAQLSSNISPLVVFMVAGAAVHGLMYFPYALQLAYGRTDLALATNLALLVVVVPVTYYLANSHGALGGALAWLAFHLLYFVVGVAVNERFIPLKLAASWIAIDIAIPLVISAGGAWCLSWLFHFFHMDILVRVLLLVPSLIMCCILSLACQWRRISKLFSPIALKWSHS